MSSLFVYHVVCAACGLTGPTLQWARMPWDPAEMALPASNLTTGELDCVVIAATPEPAQRARELTTETHRVAVPSLRGDPLTWHLTPPLPCPRCGALIETAAWG